MEKDYHNYVDFFFFLHEKLENQHADNVYPFLVPDTIVFVCQQPTRWFFSSSTGEYLAKNKCNVNAANMKKRFIENNAGGDKTGVYAQFIMPDYASKKTKVIYYSKDDLRKSHSSIPLGLQT